MSVEQEPPEIGQLRDSSVVWRACLWGGAAAMALAAAVLAMQTDLGTQRLQMVFASEPTAKPIDPAEFVPRPEADALRRETVRLEAQVRELAADREKLNARIASLETSLSDVTGSLKRELAAVAAKPAPPAPAIGAPQTAPPAPLEPIVAEAKNGHVLGHALGGEPDADPRVAPPLGEPIPLPPMRIAGVATSTSDIAIDLGGARSLDIMHARWAAVKANFGPLLNGLQPLVARDSRPNMIPYRLIVGPLPNAAAAAQVCARFAASKVTCRSTKFAGEPLTIQQ